MEQPDDAEFPPQLRHGSNFRSHKMARKFDKYDHLPPLDAVVAAWSNPGRVPAYHAYMQVRLKREWPLLARALDRLVQENQQKEKGHESA